MAALSDNDAALVFIGFMGAGKSRALRAARHAGLEAVDTDELLEAELGMPIADFFAAEGEAEFRRREEALVVAVLERAGGGAVALGGGSVLSERVRDGARRARRRLARRRREDGLGAGRGTPAAGRATARRSTALLAERRPLYESLADAIVPGRQDSPARALQALLALRDLPAGTRMAWAHSASGEYPVYVGRGLLESGFWPLEGRRFVVTDTVVGGLYADAIGPAAGAIELAPGEQTKTLAETERVLRELATLGATRSDHVAALGGGVVGDLAGFCAAIYQRGIAVVQVPTTLVAQVDSAYGGKTGVDLPEAKNYVGAYHLPAAVLTDPATLRTLPPGELAAGFVEVLKTGLIAGGRCGARSGHSRSSTRPQLDPIIFACARTKLDVVAADERDSGRRAALNLGHTVGHAIEVASGYTRYRHGEAVGLGLLAALELSDAIELRAEVEAILDRHGLPTRIDDSIELDEVIAGIGRDKKRTAAGLGFVLCPRPGEVLTDQRVEPDALRAAVERLYRA